jgi:hypothetical protein
VQPLPVVEHFDVLGHGEPGADAGVETVSVIHLVFQGGEERFGCGVIPAHAGAADAGADVVAGAERGEFG